MSTTLLMNFLVDKESKKIKVERAFNAPLETVWEAWTQPEILDQWWAPKPWRTETKEMNFSEGGYWHYAMVGPEGEKHWCLFDFRSIKPNESFSGLDAFCDEHRNISDDKPRAFWKNVFIDQKDSTLVNIEVSFDELSDLEAIIQMGFREGFTAALENLDELLLTKRVQ